MRAHETLEALDWVLSAARGVREGAALHTAFNDARCLFAMVTHPALSGLSVGAQLKQALSLAG